MTDNNSGQQKGNNPATENKQGRMHSIKKGTSTLWDRNTGTSEGDAEDKRDQPAHAAKSKHHFTGRVKSQSTDNRKGARPGSNKKTRKNKNTGSK